MLRRSGGWRYGAAACVLALLAAGQLWPQDKKVPAKDGEDKPSEEEVKLLRLNVRTFMKKHDTDKDGKLSYKEVQALFDRLDGDKDGSLDRKELSEAVKGMAGKDAKVDQHVIVFMREYDVNKDSKYSAKEAKLHFDAADTDKDGLLDENELVTAATRLLPSKKPTVEQPPKGGEKIETPPAKTKPRRLVALLGVAVVIGRDDALGKVVDIVTDEEGRVAFVLVRDADNLVAVPWGAVSYSVEEKAFTLTTRINRTGLKGVTFAQGRYPDFTSETWLRGARTVWGERALPAQPGQKPLDRKPDEKKPPEKVPPKEKDEVPPKEKDKVLPKEKDKLPPKEKDKVPPKEKGARPPERR